MKNLISLIPLWAILKWWQYDKDCFLLKRFIPMSMAYFGVFYPSPNPWANDIFFFCTKVILLYLEANQLMNSSKGQTMRKIWFPRLRELLNNIRCYVFTMFVWCFDIISIHYSRNDFGVESVNPIWIFKKCSNACGVWRNHFSKVYIQHFW